ncbi:MAG: CRISPR system precrRNA processing endoribonuclease RAMP protein Cas6 [Candidatus Xenobia bacterium]
MLALESASIASQLAALRVLSIRFRLAACGPVRLPAFSGSTFRGLLGHALRSVACSCNDSAHLPQCAYHFLFETTAPQGDDIARPFVLEPPGDVHVVPSGQGFSLGIHLLGRGADYLPWFIFAMEEMGRLGIGLSRRDHFKVVAAESQGQCFYRDGRFIGEPVETHLGTAVGEPQEVDRVLCHFLSPTRLVHQGQLATVPDLHILIRAALRRIDQVLQVHAGRALEVDYRGLVAQAAICHLVENESRWFDWERVSQRQQRSMKLGGLVGRACWQGPIGPLLPLLSASTVLHLGKNTTFGLGRIAVQVVE